MSKYLQHSLWLSLGTCISRILGLLRDLSLAWLLGHTLWADVLSVALRLPYAWRRMFGEGTLTLALSSSQLPKTEILRLSKQLAWVMLGLCGLIAIFSVQVLEFLVPGSIQSGGRVEIELLRWVLPYLVFLSLAAGPLAVLQSYNKFFISSLTPALFNLIMISGVAVAFYLSTPLLQVRLICGAVVLGGIGQWLFLRKLLQKSELIERVEIVERVSTSFKPKFRQGHQFLDPQFLCLGAGILSAAIPQLAFLIAAHQASWLQTGSLASLFYAERFLEFPLGLLGALGLGSAPWLASLVKAKQFENLKIELNRIIHLALILAVPAAAGLAAIAEPLIQILYGHGAFTASQDTAMALLGYSLGLPAYALSRPFLATYFALQNYKTPLWAGLISLGLIMVTSCLFGESLLGLGLSVSLGLWFNVLILGWFLWLRLRFKLDLKLLLWVMSGAIVTYFAASWVQGAGLMNLILAIGTGIICYSTWLWPCRRKILKQYSWQAKQKDL